MENKSLIDLLRERFELLNDSESDFLEGIAALEAALFVALKKLIERFDTKDGKIENSPDNQRKLLSLRKDIFKIIEQSTLKSKLSKFIKQFDVVEAVNKAIYSSILGDTAVAFNLGSEKRVIIDDLVAALTNKSALTVNYVSEVRKVIRNAVNFSQTINQAVDNLRTEVKGSGKGGRLLRYTRQIATDSINGFDGALQDRARDKYQLDVFQYVGSLIDTSRSNCKELIQGSGRFEDLAIRRGRYPVAAIPTIVKRAKNRPGWNPATTPSTFGQYRGGFNCRHLIVYGRSTDEERLKILARFGLEGEK